MLIWQLAQIVTLILRGQCETTCIWPKLPKNLNHFCEVERSRGGEDALTDERRVEHGSDEMDPRVVNDIDVVFCGAVLVRHAGVEVGAAYVVVLAAPGLPRACQ